jgi:hypothetical protein
MELKNSLDWQDISTKIQFDLSSIGYNPDLQKMSNNISNMVTELSKMEVTGRRLNSKLYSQELLLKINKAIDHLEKLILMGILMK